MKKLIKKLLIGGALTLTAASCQPGSSGSGGGGSTPAPNPTPVPTPTPTPYEITSPTSMNVQCNTWNDYQITANKEGGTCDAESLSSEMISNVSVDDECKVDFYVTCDSDKVGTMKVSKTSLDDKLAEQEVTVNASVDPITVSDETMIFQEDGTYDYGAKFTQSEGGLLKDSTGYIDGVEIDTIYDIDQTSKTMYLIDNPIQNDTNTARITMTDEYNNFKEIEKSFVPATEAEARTKIEEILSGEIYVKDTTLDFDANSNPACTYAEGTPLSIPVDYKIFYDGKWATINFTSFDDNLTTDLTNYNTLKNCGNIANDLQLSRFPEDEVELRTTEFKNNGFMN